MIDYNNITEYHMRNEDNEFLTESEALALVTDFGRGMKFGAINIIDSYVNKTISKFSQDGIDIIHLSKIIKTNTIKLGQGIRRGNINAIKDSIRETITEIYNSGILSAVGIAVVTSVISVVCIVMVREAIILRFLAGRKLGMFSPRAILVNLLLGLFVMPLIKMSGKYITVKAGGKAGTYSVVFDMVNYVGTIKTLLKSGLKLKGAILITRLSDIGTIISSAVEKVIPRVVKNEEKHFTVGLLSQSIINGLVGVGGMVLQIKAQRNLKLK